jgi:hydrogenase expression/formation protein HypE
LTFPGGDIGSLAVHGTVNDLAMCGAWPVALSAAFILEEGFPMSKLAALAASMARAALEVGVPIATGDTKVVERGKGDGIFITTSGVGRIPTGVSIDPLRARPGDWVLVNGPLARHGVAVLSVREGLEFGTSVISDSAPLHRLVRSMLEAVGPAVHVLRDPTRGGLASALCELADSGGVGVRLKEVSIPVEPEVRAACELFGLDPLYVANEGRCLAFVEASAAPAALAAMGEGAAHIGEVVEQHPGVVVLEGGFGGERVLDLLSGEQLPRIC